MIEQMEEKLDEQRLRDAAELERCIRETEDKLIDLRTQQAALLAGQDPAVQTVADEQDGFDAMSLNQLDAQADFEDFQNRVPLFETT